MTVALVLDLMRQAVTVGLLITAPLLGTALIVGVTVSFVQTITQIQEQTLTFVPKFIIIALVALTLLPWFLQQLVGYVISALRSLPVLIS